MTHLIQKLRLPMAKTAKKRPVKGEKSLVEQKKERKNDIETSKKQKQDKPVEIQSSIGRYMNK